jgi:hypothetical protein
VWQQARRNGSEVEIGKLKSEPATGSSLSITTITVLRRYRDRCRSPLFGEAVARPTYLWWRGADRCSPAMPA